MRVRLSNKHALAEHRLGVMAALVAAISGLLCLTIAPAAFGQAILDSNQIRGQIKFTNSNSAIVAILHNGDGLRYTGVRADSIGVTPALNNSTWVTTSDPMVLDYEITVESGSPGVSYDVRASASLAAAMKRYVFEKKTSAPVEPEPAADTIVNFSECAGVVDVRWHDTLGNPFEVSGGTMQAYRAMQMAMNGRADGLQMSKH